MRSPLTKVPFVLFVSVTARPPEEWVKSACRFEILLFGRTISLLLTRPIRTSSKEKFRISSEPFFCETFTVNMVDPLVPFALPLFSSRVVPAIFIVMQVGTEKSAHWILKY